MKAIRGDKDEETKTETAVDGGGDCNKRPKTESSSASSLVTAATAATTATTATTAATTVSSASTKPSKICSKEEIESFKTMFYNACRWFAIGMFNMLNKEQLKLILYSSQFELRMSDVTDIIQHLMTYDPASNSIVFDPKVFFYGQESRRA